VLASNAKLAAYDWREQMLVCPNCGLEIEFTDVGEPCTNCGIQIPQELLEEAPEEEKKPEDKD
jgi:predicted RNA-binding Zn-ribbon protein involved in translation (DUF1610 family)